MQIRFFFFLNRPDFYLEKMRSIFFIKNRADFYLTKCRADFYLEKTQIRFYKQSRFLFGKNAYQILY